jgi:hypothetical protein
MMEKQSELNEPVRVFLNYHHSDGIIASTLSKALPIIKKCPCGLGLYSQKPKALDGVGIKAEFKCPTSGMQIPLPLRRQSSLNSMI